MSPAVVVRALSGEVLVSSDDAGALPSLGEVRADAARALGVGPGLRCRLLHGLTHLEDDMCLADVDGPGGVVQLTAVVERAPAVSAMLRQFAGLVEVLGGMEEEACLLPVLRESTDGERLVDLLLRLGEEAAPAAQHFAEWSRQEHPAVRRLAARAIGGLGPAAGGLLERLAEMVRGDSHEAARFEAARAMFGVAEALPLEALPRLAAAVADHKDEHLRAQTYRGLRIVAREDLQTGLCARHEVRAALSPPLRRACAGAAPEVRLHATRALAKIDPAGFRDVAHTVLVDPAAWREAEERLEARLRAARGGAPPSARELRSAATVGNEAEFRLPVGTPPESLRPDLCAQTQRPFLCDASFSGEAAWPCAPCGCVRRDATTPAQDLTLANRAMRSALLVAGALLKAGLDTGLTELVVTRLEGVKPRASQVVACGRKSSQLRRAVRRAHRVLAAARHRRKEELARHFGRYPQSAHFFQKLQGIEGRDPVHMWLFPDRGAAPREDFEPPRRPSPLRSWGAVSGGSARCLP